MPVTEPGSTPKKDNPFRFGDVIDDALDDVSQSVSQAVDYQELNGPVGSVNDRITSFDEQSMRFMPDTIGHLVTQSPLQDEETGWMGELFGDAIPWVQELTKFADIPGQLLSAHRWVRQNVQDRDTRYFTNKFLNDIQKLPPDQQNVLLLYLQGYRRQKQEGTLLARAPGNLPNQAAGRAAESLLTESLNLETFSAFGEGSALNYDAGTDQFELDVEAAGPEATDILASLEELFPGLDIKNIDAGVLERVAEDSSDWLVDHEGVQYLLDTTHDVLSVRAEDKNITPGDVGFDLLRIYQSAAYASGDVGFDIAGNVTRRIPFVGRSVADFAGRQARAAEKGISKAVEPIITAGYEPIGRDPVTGEPIYSIEDQRSIEAKAGAFIFLTGLGGGAAGSLVGRAGRRIKMARTAAGREAASAALGATRSVARGGVFGTLAEVYRLPVRRITEVVDKALVAFAKDPEKFFVKGVNSRQGRILLDTLDEAKRLHPGDSTQALDGQVGFVRQAYGDQLNERLVREMLKAPNRDIAKRVFVDTLMNPEAGTHVIRRLNKQRQTLTTRLRELEVDAETRPARRAEAEARLREAKAAVDAAPEVTPELRERVRTALAEYRRIDTEENEIGRLRLADIDLDYRIKTTFDDTPMLKYPKQNIIRAAAKGVPTTRWSKILHGIFVRDAKILDPAKLVDELPRYPELHPPGSGAPANALQLDSNTISTYLRRAGVPPRVIEERLGALARVKSRTEWFDLVERTIWGPGGDIDKALPASIDPELRGRLINLHDAAVEARSYSWLIDTVETPHGLSRAERPVLGTQRIPGEWTPFPSRPSEFIQTVSLPDVNLLIEADAVIKRLSNKVAKTKGLGAAHQLLWRMPQFVLRLGTLIGKPLVMLPRVLLGAMPAKIQLEQMLRNANFGYKPLKGLPNGITLFPGGIPVPLTRGVRVGRSLFGENGWRLLDPDPRLKGMSSPEATDMGMFMSELLDEGPVERVVETTYEFRAGRRNPKWEHWDAFRKELEQANSDFIDRKLAQLGLDEDEFIAWLGKDFEAGKFLAEDLQPQLDRAFKDLPPIDEALRPKRLEIENSFVEMAGYTDEGYFYHVTRPEFFDSIRETGLSPKTPPRGSWEDGGTDARVYLGVDAPTSSAMANIIGRGSGADLKKMVLLRVSQEKVPQLVERVGFPEAEVATNAPIPAKSIEYLANDGQWRLLPEGRETTDPVRMWVQSRIQYLQRLTREDPKYLETIATGRSRAISRLGADKDATGQSVRAKHNEMVEKLDLIGTTLKEKLAEQAPHPEIVALQHERLLTQRALDRLRRDHPNAITETKSIELSDKRRWNDHVQEEWLAGRMELPDRLLVEKRIRGWSRDMGVLGNFEHLAQGLSGALYRPFKVLSYADKHGTRGSLFTQANARMKHQYRARGLSPDVADAIAYARAGEITRDLMYDLTARTSFQRSLENYFWFAPAWQEVMYTWAVKIPAAHAYGTGYASLALKGLALIDVLSATGIIRENSEGEKVLVVPGLGALLDKLPGVEVPDTVFSRFDILNFISPGGGVPGLSTPASWGLGVAAKKWGGVFKSLSDIFQQYGPDTTALPAPITYWWEAITGSPPPFEPLGADRIKADWDRSFDFGIQYAFADLQNQGITPPRPEDFGKLKDGEWVLTDRQQIEYEQANKRYVTELMGLAQQYGCGIAFVRAIGSSSSPVSFYVTNKEREEWENFWNKIIVPTGFGDQGLSDRQRDLIDDYISQHPGSFAYSVFYKGQGEKVRDLPFSEELDDAFYDSYLTGESRTLEPREFQLKLMATEARRYYQGQLNQAFNEISPNRDPWVLLTNGYERKDALNDYRAAWERWEHLNPRAHALLLDQEALWRENNNVPIESFEVMRLAETLNLLDQVAPMLTGEEGLRPNFLRDTRTQLAILYSEQGDFGEPNTRTEKALAWWFDNVFDSYIEETTPLYEEAQGLQSLGLSPSAVYNQIREIQNRKPPKYKGEQVPSVEAMFFGNRNEEEREAAITAWRTRPASWLSDFQLEQAGYEVTPDVKTMLDEISKTDQKMWQYINEQGITSSSKEWDQEQANRERYLENFAQGLGPDAVRVWRLNEAAPYERLNEFGFGQALPDWGNITSAVSAITARIEAAGYSPRGFSQDVALPQKIFLYRAIAKARAENFLVDSFFTQLSYSFPLPKEGWREGALLYEAVFFGNFSTDHIPYDVAQAAAGV